MKNTSLRIRRQEIVRFGKMLHDRGLVAAMEGNLSMLLEDGRVLCSPTLMCKGMMQPADLVIVDLCGRHLAGRRNVSSEIGMHLMIYRQRPDVRAVVHAHPPTATGFAAAGLALDQPLLPEVVLGLGSVPLAQYATPGTPELADALEPYVANYNAILMQNHGVVSYGPDLESAYLTMEAVEQFAKISLVAHQLGGGRPLEEDEIKKLAAVKEKYLLGALIKSSR